MIPLLELIRRLGEVPVVDEPKQSGMGLRTLPHVERESDECIELTLIYRNIERPDHGIYSAMSIPVEPNLGFCGRASEIRDYGWPSVPPADCPSAAAILIGLQA
jgi:hypothetical protein